MHTEPDEDEDASGQNLPVAATHGAQAEEPLNEKVPGRHALHHADDVAAVVVEYFPLVQSEQANDPGNELYPPAGQSAHSADPNEALCLPAEQITHSPPSGPLKPALHRHAVAEPLPGDE